MARRFLLLAFSSLAACGGGGGGSSNGGGTGGGGGAGGGGAPPFALIESNAVEAAGYAFHSAEEVFVSSLITVNVGRQLREENTTQLIFSCSPGSSTLIELSYEDRDATGTLTATDVVRFKHDECGGVSRNLSLTLSVFEPTEGWFEGRVNFDTSLDPPGFRFAGSLDLVVTSDSTATRWRTSNVSLTLTSGGTQQFVRIGSSETIAMPTSYEFSAAGGSVESARLGGSYTFATTTAFTGRWRRLPTEGALTLSTSSGSRVSITPPGAHTLGEATVDYAVAAPSGGFGTPQQAVWTALINGDLFDWLPNDPPVIPDLTLHPANPAPGADFFAAFDVSDPNEGDSVTIDITWRLNGVVVASSGRTLKLPTVRNDVVEVTITVTDDRGATATRTASVTIGNIAPVLTSLSIMPQSPDTTADLVAEASVSDPDGDPLLATYVWSRNGTVLTAHTTATLPASETTRGDTIEVNVTFDDDGLSVSGTAVAVILDAPPRIAVAAPPPSAVYGMPTGFMASASDPDGDSVDQLRFDVAYGPAGMTVDPVTGVVSWTPAGPMFDRILDVSWGITVDVPGAHAATGTTRVEDPARSYALLSTGIQIPLLGSLRIGDFDDDGDTEMLLLGVRWLLEIEADGAGGYRQSWAYPFAFEPDDDLSTFGVLRTIATGDADGDGHYEIFVATDNRLVKLDGVERRVVSSVTLSPDESCTDLEYGDLDGDGAAELICAARFDNRSERLLVYRANDLSELTALAAAPVGARLTPGSSRLALANVDADAALEIVTSGGYVIDGATTAIEWQRADGFPGVATGDIDGDGVDEIVSVVSFGELAAFRFGDATPLFTVPSEPLDIVLVTDIDGDARAEILAGGNQHGNVTAYRYDAGAGTGSIVFQIDNQEHGVSAFGTGDVDGDSQVEIVWGTGLSSDRGLLVVAGLNPNIAVEWTNADPIQVEGPFVGGALAGSPTTAPAPLFLTRTRASGLSGARLVRVDPLDGDIEIGPVLGTTLTSVFSMLAVDDYDEDGTDEALLASIGQFDATPTVYDFFGENVEWTLAQFEPAVQLASGNVCGDPRDELVWLGENGVISVLDVETQQLVWQSPMLNGARGLKLADLDGNGEDEIIAVTPSSMQVFARAAAPDVFQQAASVSLAGDVVDLTAGDTDGDGRGEIFVLVSSPNPPNSPHGFVSPSFVAPFDAELRAREPFVLPWRARSIAIEPSAFARKNLLVGRAEGALPASRLVTIDARNGAVVSASPPLIGAISRDSVHYVEVDPGSARLSIGTEGGMYLTR